MKHPLRWILLAGLLLQVSSHAHAEGFSISGATVTLSTPLVFSIQGDVILSSGSLVANGSALNVTGNWTQANGTFISGTSTVTFQGSSNSTSTLTGSTTFYSLRCTTAGQGLILQAGSTQTVTGSLILTGASGNLLRLRSSVPGNFAYLINSGTHTVSFVSAQDNNASGGQAIRAGTSSVNAGHTSNWSFGEPPPTNPVISAVSISSLSVSWGAVNSITGYSFEASTANDFTGILFSSQTTNPATTSLSVGTASPLASDTTYYLRVGALYNGTTTYGPATPTSTSTLTSPLTGTQFADVFVTSATINWIPLSAAQGYTLTASTSPNFTTLAGSSITTSVNVTTLTVSNLAAFTTYYFRVGGVNWNGVINYAAFVSTRTTPGGPPGNPILNAVHVTSITVDWSTAAFSTGYEVDASTANDFSGILFSSVTASPITVQLTVGVAVPLAPDTTYFLRVSALYNGATIYAAANPSTSTLTATILGIQFSQIFTSSITVSWLPLASAQSYELDASTSSDFAPLSGSSTTTNVLLSTLTVEGLTGNTHYFFRVGGLNWNAVPHFSLVGSATAGIGVSPSNPQITDVQATQMTVMWGATPSGTGYEVDASTAEDFTGTLTSSITFDLTVTTLTVGSDTSLLDDTTYYLQVGALYNGATSYIDTSPGVLSTLTQALSGTQITELFSTSITVNWATLARTQGYRLDISTTNDFMGIVYSSTTPDAASSALTLVNLTAGTAYFLRAGGLNWSDTPHFVTLGSTQTPPGPAPVAPVISQVLVTSITVAWGLVNADNGYTLEASTASNFSGIIFSSVTADGTANTLSVQGLGPNSTYFLRVGSIWNQTTNYALTTPASTTTLVVLTNGIPDRPVEVTGASLGLGGGFVLSWRTVTLNTQGQPTPIGYYVIERSTNILGSYIPIANVAASTFNFTDVTNGQTLYYRVRTADANNNLSQPSDIIDSSPQANRHILAADDPLTALIIPGFLNLELLAENNPSGDIQIALTRNPTSESGQVLWSYDITARQASSGNLISNFSFSQTQIVLEMDYSGIDTTSLQRRALTLPETTMVAPYWINGSIAVPLTSPTPASQTPLSVSARNLGLYQVRISQDTEGRFRLLPGSPYPRILTPNRLNENRRLFFFFANPSGESVTATIYNLRGAKVRDLTAGGLSPTSNSLVWDVRNEHGNIVPSGIYLYKLKSGEEVITGTVVVAR